MDNGLIPIHPGDYLAEMLEELHKREGHTNARVKPYISHMHSDKNASMVAHNPVAGLRFALPILHI